MRSRKLHLAVRSLFITGMLLFLTTCSDNATIKESKEDLKNVNCMRLIVFPPDKFLSETVQKLYDFDENCSYRLSISQKSGIVCNSNQNADKKRYWRTSPRGIFAWISQRGLKRFSLTT